MLVARRGFSLVELLVVVGVLAILAALVVPSIAVARESARAGVCASNLRQIHVICRGYADEHGGFGPAIGQPYAAPPNWGLVVMGATGLSGESPASYTKRSVLVCPTSDAFYGREMTRTYAMNATGHAGAPGDRDNYDDPGRTAHLDLDRVEMPGQTPLVLDAAVANFDSDMPPPTRTASVVDFRQAEHVRDRIGRVHARRSFHLSMLDGSASSATEIDTAWTNSSR